MKVLLARLPDFIGLSGLTVGITALQQATVLNNSGIPAALINSSGDIFYNNVTDALTGWYNINVYHNSNYVARGSVKLGSPSGYYLVNDPVQQYNDLNDAIQNLTGSLTATLVIPATSLPEVTGTNLSIFKGTTWNFNISGIGSDADNFYITFKTSHHVPDSQATLQIDSNGLTYLNQVPQNNVSGVLTYSADNGGTLNVFVNPVVTSQIPAGLKYSWDVKAIDTETTIRSFGSCTVKEDVTDAI